MSERNSWNESLADFNRKKYMWWTVRAINKKTDSTEYK